MGLFTRSRKSLVKETSYSSQESIPSPQSSAPSTPSTQPSPLSPYAYVSEKISVVSDSPLLTQRSVASSSKQAAPSTQQKEISPLREIQPVIPSCRSCAKPGTRLITRSSNRNGNAGRPYYKCFPCDKFLCFDDSRGEDEKNPLCRCGRSSRRQLSSREKGREIFYVCSTGSCQFFERHKRADGSNWSVGDDVAEALAELHVI